MYCLWKTPLCKGNQECHDGAGLPAWLSLTSLSDLGQTTWLTTWKLLAKGYFQVCLNVRLLYNPREKFPATGVTEKRTQCCCCHWMELQSKAPTVFSGTRSQFQTKMGNCELRKGEVSPRMWWSLSVWQKIRPGIFFCSFADFKRITCVQAAAMVCFEVGKRLCESYMNFHIITPPTLMIIIKINACVFIPWIP